MRKAILGVAVAASAFALSSAFATGITLTGGSTIQGQTSDDQSVTSTVCVDPYTVTYTLTENGTVTHVLFEDTAAETSPGCKGAAGALTLDLNVAANVTDTATSHATTGDFDFTLDTPLDITVADNLVTNTKLVITAP